jgi:antitoxin (DNA-binding transcriptional repressor) of toxin-antitoxin stability system
MCLMKRISIRELHEATGRWVREAVRVEELVVTERGRPIATIVPYVEPVRANAFKTRKLRPGYAKLLGRLRGGTDSSAIVSDSRDRP